MAKMYTIARQISYNLIVSYNYSKIINQLDLIIIHPFSSILFILISSIKV